MRKSIPYIVIALLVLFLFRQDGRETVRTERHIDTLIIRDTVRDTLPIPHKVYISRVDTVYLPVPADTVVREVLVPVERKEYRTGDYHAVIEGYRPELTYMEVFPETRYITDTRFTTLKKRPRFGVGIQAGYGYNGREFAPYVGLGVQYNLFTF